MSINILASLLFLALCISFLNAAPYAMLDNEDLNFERSLLSARAADMLLQRRATDVTNYVKNANGYYTGGDGLRYYTSTDAAGNLIVFRIDLPGQYAIPLPTNGLYLISRDGLRKLITSNGGSLA